MVTQTDIANRALQHCGGGLIAAGAFLTEDSKNASELRACYDLNRRAELRRNVWRFATRKTAIRPLDATSKLVTFGTWASGTTYALNDIVLGSDGQVYISIASGNLANNPTLGTFSKWSVYFGPLVAVEHASVAGGTTTYFAGELVYIGATMYLSKISGNADTPPTANWQTMSTAPTLALVSFIYPLGAGPLGQSDSKQAYRLPNGYMMLAPQDPKEGSVPVLGWPRGQSYKDWEFESDYLLTSDSGVIILRFVADVNDPNSMDPMFIEGFACRLALSVCETITQSGSKLSNIGSMYGKFMVEARTVNGIETGPVEQELDAYVECRI
jgi:hypothetical protein